MAGRKQPEKTPPPLEVSSLIALFRGDEDCPAVPHPELVVLILDGLADPKSGGRFMGSQFTLADRLFPELADSPGPKTVARYADEIGTDVWNAVVTGLALWKKRSAEPEAA